jgi:hypothetical protein
VIGFARIGLKRPGLFQAINNFGMRKKQNSVKDKRIGAYPKIANKARENLMRLLL